MVKHIVMWKLKPEHMEENARAIKEALENLQSDFEELMDIAQDMGVI